MSIQTDLLQRIDLFQTLDQKTLGKIARICIEREYSRGDYIVRQGEAGLGLFFITRGKAKVEIERDGAKLVVAELKAEESIGELSIVDNMPRSANVICLEDTSCLLLTRDSFTKLLNKTPEIAIQMVKALAVRLRATNERVGQAPITSSESIPAAPPASPPEPAISSPKAAESSSPPSGGSTSETSAKYKFRDYLVDTFNYLYMMKALTRFSAAIVGCPVRLSSPAVDSGMFLSEFGGVKLALFPSSADQTIQIDAFDHGEFSAIVLRPILDKAAKITYTPQFSGSVSRGDRLQLHVPALAEPWLEQ